MSEKRQKAIEYRFFHHYISPKLETWNDINNIVSNIMGRLGIPRGSSNCVKNVMMKCLNQNDDIIDVVSGRGRKSLIKHNSPEDTIILNCVMKQLSLENTMEVLNDWKVDVDSKTYNQSSFICD
jgi:hypothetical protein